MSVLKNLQTTYAHNQFLYLVGGYVGLFAHPLYWFIWTYLLPGFYESAWLRFLCSASAVPVIFLNYWPTKAKTYFPIYWFFLLMLQLPVTFTYLTLMNNFTGAWLVCETMMFLVLAVFYPRMIFYLLNLVLGMGIALIMYVYQKNGLFQLDMELVYFLAPIPMAVFCVVIFGYAINKSHIETNELLKSLGGSIAHEIRNPLNSLLIAVEEIEEIQNKNTPLGLKTLFLTKICKEQINNGNSIIEMTLNNIHGKPIDPQSFIALSFNQCMQNVLSSYAFRSGERNRVFFQSEHDFIFMGDAALFSYTLFNLLKNALYYLKSYPDSKIEIKAYAMDKQNIVSFKDTGPGIPARLIPKLFEDFSTFGKAGGTGLGLPFCKRVMQSFGGSIYCRSVEGQYTEFFLNFPQTLNSQKIIDNPSDLPTVNEGLTNKSVLLVDDDVTSSTIISKYLSRTGVNCDVAENGHKALKMLEHKNYDAIFMDIQMPVMNGLEATREIRKSPTTKKIIIIGLTGASSSDEIKEAMRSGMDDHLIKPVKRELLIEKLNYYLRQ